MKSVDSEPPGGGVVHRNAVISGRVVREIDAGDELLGTLGTLLQRGDQGLALGRGRRVGEQHISRLEFAAESSPRHLDDGTTRQARRTTGKFPRELRAGIRSVVVLVEEWANKIEYRSENILSGGEDRALADALPI